MPKTLEEYIEEYRHHLRKKNKSKCTVINYILAIKQLLCSVINDKEQKSTYEMKYTPETLNYDYLEDYCYKIKQKYNPNTQRIKLSGIKRYLRYIKAKYDNKTYDTYENEKELYHGKDEDILRPNPASDKYEEPLTHEEVKKFFEISKFDLRNNAFLKMLYYTGGRVHSVINMNIDDIDFTPRTNENGIEYYNVTIIYLKGKWKKPIVVAVDPDTIISMKEYLREREDTKEGHVYDNYRNKLYHKDAVFLNGYGKRITYIGIYVMMKRYAVKLKLNKRIHPHLWRGTIITMMDKAGMTEGEIKRVTGHSKKSDALKGYINPKISDVIDGYHNALNIDKQEKPQIQQEPQKEVDVNQLLTTIQNLQKQIQDLKQNKDMGYQ